MSEPTDDEFELWVEIRNARDTETAAIQQYLEKQAQRAGVPPSTIEKPVRAKYGIPNLDKVNWKDATGKAGPFRLANEELNRDNIEFKNLQGYMREHKGKAVVAGEWVWLFSDNVTVGRKPRNQFIG